MDKKPELKDEELKRVSGGSFHQDELTYKCNDCGARIYTNSTRVKKCKKCGSTNIKYEYNF